VKRAFIGIDVQAARGCPYVVLDRSLSPRLSGWLRAPEDALPVVVEASKWGRVAVGIDGPRTPLPSRREHFWTSKGWRRRMPKELGCGRHCEVVISAHRVANPQWTRVAASCPAWMRVGFKLFELLTPVADVHEVFPSAAYKQLAGERAPVFTVSLAGFHLGPKDMLDAYVAAYTVHEFLAGRGVAVGGGDGLGAIILPRPLSPVHERVLQWPQKPCRTTHCT
jgi:hypothetical protein